MSEINEEYERGFIDGMQKQMQSSVDRWVNATAPRELSDEEIIEIRDSCYVQSGIDEWEFDDVVFARAILKKAREK